MREVITVCYNQLRRKKPRDRIMAKNKAEQLYDQCLDAYEKYREGSAYQHNDMPGPNPFDDSYVVPAELLFIELCKHNKAWREDRVGFDNKLLTWIYQREEFDIEKFSDRRSVQKIVQRSAQHEVYFEVILRKAPKSRLPFYGALSINGASFQWCSLKEMKDTDAIYIQTEALRRQNTKVQYISNGVQPYRQWRKYGNLRNREDKNTYQIKPTVYAGSSLQAAELSLREFGLVSDCFNVAYRLGNYSASFFRGEDNSDTTTSHAVMCDTGVCLVRNSTVGVERYRLNSKSSIMPQSYQPKANRNKMFHELVNAVKSNSIISPRIRNVVRELALAFSADNIGLAHLAFWRCLEHATRRIDNSTRKESEIIRIFQNYCTNEYWKQMGGLIKTLRNNYVHDGVITNNGCRHDYLNWSQKYAERALYVLLYLERNKDYWSSNIKIDKFFDYYAESDESLEAAQKLLKERHRTRG